MSGPLTVSVGAGCPARQVLDEPLPGRTEPAPVREPLLEDVNAPGGELEGDELAPGHLPADQPIREPPEANPGESGRLLGVEVRELHRGLLLERTRRQLQPGIT